MRLAIGPEFPNAPPKGYFLTKIFHPNVSASGEICVNVLKRDWKPDLGLRHVLTVIRCLLIEPNAESGAPVLAKSLGCWAVASCNMAEGGAGTLGLLEPAP